jgi:hypothetical protein
MASPATHPFTQFPLTFIIPVGYRQGPKHQRTNRIAEAHASLRCFRSGEQSKDRDRDSWGGDERRSGTHSYLDRTLHPLVGGEP